MGKNIILCSDGTGNRGGETPDTNVYKIYNAIKINKKLKEEKEEGNKKKPSKQITFYDNGVGTSKSTLIKALGEGFGVGFRENVRDLYEFLGRHYEEGDDIYIFGFSRGAATVRAFAGLVEHCGLVSKKIYEDSEDKFQEEIDQAIKAYQKGKLKRDKDGIVEEKNFKKAEEFKKRIFVKEEHDIYKNLKIEFMGIWDTVSSLGAPQIRELDYIIDIFIPHKFYDLEPENCVKHVYHAIAVDDERRTFWPLVWNEKSFYGEDDNGAEDNNAEDKRKGKIIEQVWFPGMHSNVGGGYHRQELANVTLDWMIARLEQHREIAPNGGIDFKSDIENDANADADPFGKLHNSRDGLAIFYRYNPRPIEKLCKDRLSQLNSSKGKVKIHDSVIRRMKMEIANYAPGQLPNAFDVVATRESGHQGLESPKKAEYEDGNKIKK
jgi:uncharacterized protein (DUF2235 family)